MAVADPIPVPISAPLAQTGGNSRHDCKEVNVQTRGFDGGAGGISTSARRPSISTLTARTLNTHLIFLADVLI